MRRLSEIKAPRKGGSAMDNGIDSRAPGGLVTNQGGNDEKLRQILQNMGSGTHFTRIYMD